MSESDYCRERAAEALSLAAASNLPNVRTRYIVAAETWERFAERAADVSAWQCEFKSAH